MKGHFTRRIRTGIEGPHEDIGARWDGSPSTRATNPGIDAARHVTPSVRRENDPRLRYPAPKGLVSRMSFGSRVSAASSAIDIASPVSSPK